MSTLGQVVSPCTTTVGCAYAKVAKAEATANNAADERPRRFMARLSRARRLGRQIAHWGNVASTGRGRHGRHPGRRVGCSRRRAPTAHVPGCRGPWRRGGKPRSRKVWSKSCFASRQRPLAARSSPRTTSCSSRLGSDASGARSKSDSASSRRPRASRASMRSMVASEVSAPAGIVPHAARSKAKRGPGIVVVAQRPQCLA